MITIKQNKENRRIYNRISGYISRQLLKVKAELPKQLEVIITDYEAGRNNTGLWREAGKYYIEVNLRELRRLYNQSEYIKRGFKPGLSFRKYISFALYHELGHYKKHFYNRNPKELYRLAKLRDTDIEALRVQEAEADYTGRELWQAVYNRQAEFNF